MSLYSQIRDDFQRHGKSILNPAFWAVSNYHFGKCILEIKFAPIRWFLRKLYGFNLFLIHINSGICIYCETEIGENLHLIHSGNIQIHPKTVIGNHCGIQQDVTIGLNIDSDAPVIGDNVYIGAGAKILGGITVGDGATIAANSLVIKDVPPNTTAIGVPARVWNYSPRKKHEEDKQAER